MNRHQIYNVPPNVKNKWEDIHAILNEELTKQGKTNDIEYRVHKAQTEKSEAIETISKPLKDLSVGISDKYIYCDSFDKRDDSVMNQGLLIFDVRDLNNQIPIKNFIEVEIILPFYIPEPLVDTTYQPAYFYFGHILIEMETIGGYQYVNAGLGKKFHFDLETESAGGVIFRLHRGLSKYIFNYPVRSLQEISIRFKTPLRNIEFLSDIFDVTVNVAGIAPFNQRFITSVPHSLIIGGQYTVYFKNFNSTNGTLNTTKNNTIGHLADVIDSTTIQLTNTLPLISLLASLSQL